MKVKSRSVSAIVVALTALAIAGLYVPAASAAPDKFLEIVAQPQDSVAGDSIRTADLSSGTDYIQVQLVDGDGILITNTGNMKVTFDFAPGSVTNNSLTSVAQPFVGGIATFAPVEVNGNVTPTLSIGTPNEPQFTSYSIVPSTTGGGPKITGDASDPFDIFQDGESCLTAGTCTADLPHGNGNGDAYSVPNVTVGTTLGASELSDDTLPGFDCTPGVDTEIFDDSVFVNVTTESDADNIFAPVKLESHITRQEMKKAANNGQAHVQWCVGLKFPEDWAASGGSFVEQDTNGDLPGGILYVGFAPACPQSSPTPQDFAPCIDSQTGDGNGGNITIGWLPGGDPPRRT